MIVEYLLYGPSVPPTSPGLSGNFHSVQNVGDLPVAKAFLLTEGFHFLDRLDINPVGNKPGHFLAVGSQIGGLFGPSWNQRTLGAKDA